jgi:hypothetical protein
MKEKTVSLSSTEAEVIGVVEAITYVLWLVLFLRELGFEITFPFPIYQDNLSAIMLYNGGGTFKRSKHMLLKTSYIKDILAQKIIQFFHLSGKIIPSDMLTKPVARSTLLETLQFLNIMPINDVMGINEEKI